jgi:hypothetical protein
MGTSGRWALSNVHAGLNGFKGLQVTQPNITLETKNNFHAFVIIPNPSVLTIELVSFTGFPSSIAKAQRPSFPTSLSLTCSSQGNATFHNYLEGKDIGTVYMDNLTLRPGDNNVTVHADIQQGPVLQGIVKKPYCESGIMEFQMQGKDVTNHGEELSYFRDALASANQTVSIDIGTPLKALKFPVACKS